MSTKKLGIIGHNAATDLIKLSAMRDLEDISLVDRVASTISKDIELCRHELFIHPPRIPELLEPMYKKRNSKHTPADGGHKAIKQKRKKERQNKKRGRK